MQSLNNSVAIVTASPQFIALLASTGLFSMRLCFGCGDKSIVEIRFRKEVKCPEDWAFNLVLFDR